MTLHRWHTVTAVLAGLVLALAVAGTGHAEPSPAELEAEIDRMWIQLEPTIEAHNKIKAELTDNKAKADALTAQIEPLQLQMDLALSRVSAISAHYYRGGNVSVVNALLDAGSPSEMVDQLGTLNQLARSEQLQIKGVVELKEQYDAQKKPLDELVGKLTEQEADLAKKEQTINAEIKRLNDLRVKAYGSTGGTGNLRPVQCPFDYVGGPAAKAAQTACQQIGKPYSWGSDGPGSFDCSGLTMYAWGAAGVRLRHFTGWQYSDTQRISRSDLRVGDLVFYYSDRHHVGIYVGGNWIVHAPSSGDVVRMKRVDDAPINGIGRVRS